MSVGEIVATSEKSLERRREQEYFDVAHAARESAAASWKPVSKLTQASVAAASPVASSASFQPEGCTSAVRRCYRSHRAVGRDRRVFIAEEIQWSESILGELSNAINLVTPEDAKGFEFDAVIVVYPQSILDMPHDVRLLYIVLTRTTTRLDVFSQKVDCPSCSAPRLFPLAGKQGRPETWSEDRLAGMK